MLILTRRVGEAVVIGNDISVTIVGVRGSQVRLGIKAPKDVTVYRKEVLEHIRPERLPARLM